MAELEILPAVDVADGQAVQLVQGVANTGSYAQAPRGSSGAGRATIGCTGRASTAAR